MDLQKVQAIAEQLREQVHKAIVGQDEALDLLLVSLFAEGHVLLEGVPGTAKTLLVRAFAAAMSLDFGRIQFTPDLMPGDVIGTNLFNFQSNTFQLVKGPIFTEVLLADEINRTPPKTQAALLQAMQERQVTIDNSTHDLGAGFIVIATQNPIEQQGTYPLPEAQLDRFLFKHVLGYPERSEEIDIVSRHGHRGIMPRLDELGITAIVDLSGIVACRQTTASIRVSQEIVAYVVDLVRATRDHPSLQFGASPRAANMLATAARAYAAIEGRDYVIPDDVKFLAVPCLRHRLVLAPGAEIEGQTVEQVIAQIIDQVPAPR
ncbi:AAA family ATPase [Dongia deserti]|uniref:AAA family ATPase n=1 Tax=Dongia deserti TaxID=2268030 RepID=UPI000E64E16D|nr:MoxR family ATPase [Dongia deserti]